MYGAIAFTLYFSVFAKFIFAKAYLKFAKAKIFFAKAKLQEKTKVAALLQPISR